MRRIIKIALIIVIFLFSIVLLDTLQALVFNNNPVIGIETKCKKKEGILVNTYHCDGKNITKLKFFNSSCDNDICGDNLEEKITFNLKKILESNHLSSSNPYDYIDNQYYKNIISFGSDAINVIINMYKTGKLSGLGAYILAIAIDEINGCNMLNDWSTIDGFYKYYNNYTCSSNDVSLTIKEGTLSSNGAIFVLKNTTDKEYWYGPEFRLEKKEDNRWVSVPTIDGNPLVWNSVLYTLESGDIEELEIDWSFGYGVLGGGEYRIIKSVFRKDNSLEEESKTIYLQSNFNLPIIPSVVGGTSNTIEVIKKELHDGNKYNNYYELNGRILYFNSNIDEVYYNDANNKMTLKEYISDVWKDFDRGIKHISNYLEEKIVLRDGGTTIYKSKEFDITLIKCNTILGNRDVFLGDYGMSFDNDAMCKR